MTTGANHTHKHPSVTQVIGRYADFSMIPEEVLSMASERGTIVHAVCASYALGLPYMRRIPENCLGYIDSFKNWFDRHVSDVLAVEKRFFDEQLGFHGQPDFILVMKSEGPVLVDLKTPAVLQKLWRLQLAAYKHLSTKIGKYGIRKAGSLRLFPNGNTARMDWYDKMEAYDFNVFLCMLQVEKFINSR
ncbi:MAG: hypothetical protein JW943_07450 [Deltaproteobacteria bacterium]|nr:hypothetical protein [Deltaproteobacteria bacterium]